MINFLGGIKREMHHVKQVRDGQDRYEPAMFIIREELKGRSFIVPLSCLWKYLDPKDNVSMRQLDAIEFDRLANKIYQQRMFMSGVRGETSKQLAEDAAAIILAEQFNENTGIMLCTGFSLVKCCQILDITVSGQSLGQLLMFIQDGLDDLKNMPNAEEENTVEQGEVCITVNGKKYHHDLSVSESDLVGGA